MKKIIIAIDGLSSSGKSTMAKNLAKAIGYKYVDSGAMYRAVTYYAMQHGFFNEDGTLNITSLKHKIDKINISFHINPETGQSETYLNDANVEQQIRNLDVASKVSQIATIDFVRHALVKKQKEMGQSKGIVMDGRDIGTAVFPDAELKIFMTASAEVRAQRRLEEMHAKGQQVSFQQILDNVKQRDQMDMTRSESPLRKAPDAIELDNTQITVEKQQEWLMDKFRQAIAK